jgi:hypothetical protein
MSKNNLWIYKIAGFFFFFIAFLILNSKLALAQLNCSQCHANVEKELQSSVHSFLSCTSCHKDVEAFPHPEGVEVTKKESISVCTTCHTGRVADSYQQSFHGKAVYLGSQRAASCADCHSTHQVLSQDNPQSQVAKANIPQTCAQCHDNPSPGFAEGSEHFELVSMGPSKPIYYTAKFFVWLTIIVMTLLVIHIELQLYRDLRNILAKRKQR